MTRRDAWSFLGGSAWILVLLALPLTGFALYTWGQLQQVESRNLRNLARAAEAIEALVANAQTTVRSLMRQTDYACQFVNRQTRLELVEPPSCTQIERMRPGPGQPDASLKIELEQTGGDLQLALNLDPAGLQGGESEQTLPSEPAPANIRFKVRFDELLEEVPFGRDLDIVFVANHKGEVVSQFAGGVHQERETSGDVGREAPLRVVSLLELERPGGGSIELAGLLRATSVASASIAGAGYQLLCQPLEIRGLRDRAGAPKDASGTDTREAAAGAGRWVLCGLVDQDRRLRDALLIAPHYVVGLTALVLLVTFAWPILKFLAISPRERVRFGDVYFLLLGSWGALMFGVLVVVAYDTHAALTERQQESLERLAGHVEANLVAEIRDMRRQLQQLDGGLVQLAKAAEGCVGDPATVDRDSNRRLRLSKDQADVSAVLEPRADTPHWARLATYKYADSAFWVHPCDGQQFLKLTVRRDNTPSVSVRGREYFQAVQAGDLWELDPQGPNAEPDAEGASKFDDRFFMQTFRSLTTGEFAAALSMKSKLDVGTLYCESFEGSWRDTLRQHPACGKDPVTAMAISGRPVSTTYPVLPPGIGFAVMSQDGTVVFHSDERRAVFENLYEEIGGAEMLAAAAVTRTALHLKTSYGARPHSVFVQPMAGLPWFSVAFADSQLLWTHQIEVLMTGGFYVLVHLAVYFFLTVLYVVLRGRATPTWLWPYMSTRPSDYAWMTWLLAIVMVVNVLALQLLNGSMLLWVSLTAPVAPILALMISRTVVNARHNQWWCRALSLGGATLALVFALAIWRGAFGVRTPGTGEWVTAVGLLSLWLAGPAVMAWEQFRRPAPADPGTAGIEALARRLALSRLGLKVAAVIIWLTIAVLPAWGYAKFAVAEQLAVLVRHENLQLRHALRTRNAAIDGYYRGIDFDDQFLRQRKSLGQRDIYWDGLFGPPAKGVSVDASTGRAADRALCERVEPDASAPKARCMASRRLRDCLATPDAWLVHLPIYNLTALQMRHLVRDELDAGWWMARTTGGPDEQPDFAFCPKADGLDDAPILQSWLPVAGAQLGTGSAMAAIVLILLLAAWVRFGAQRLFFGDISVMPEERYFAGLFQPEPKDVTPRSVSGVGRRLGVRASREWMDRELDAWPAGRELIGDEWKKRCLGWTRREALEELVEFASPHYAAMWQDCSPDEQLVLIQLSREGVANPKQIRAVSRLLRRSLVVRDPVLRVMNQSFAMYALRALEPQALASLEREQQGFGWRRLKWLLLAGVAAIITFLWMTQPAVVQGITAYMAAAVAGATAFMKLATTLGQVSGKGAQN